MARPVRAAPIGCGRIAQVAHLPALENAAGIALIELPPVPVIAQDVAEDDATRVHADLLRWEGEATASTAQNSAAPRSTLSAWPVISDAAGEARKR